MRRSLAVVALVWGTLWIGIACAQPSPAGYPNKPIRLILTVPPGGSVDPTARLMASKVGQRVGQQMIVDNRTGGNGLIAVETVARAAPDGYTLFLGTPTSMVTRPLMSKPYHPVRDFEPVTLIVFNPFVLVVPSSLPVKSLRDLIDLAKRKPGALNFGSSGQGGQPHIAVELLKSMTGIDIVHVPYKGGGPANVDLIAGRIHLYASSIIGVSEHVKSGKLNAIAISSDRRSTVLPDVPTAAESGLPGYEYATWYGIFVPAKTQSAVIGKLNAEIIAAMRDPEVVKLLTNQGTDIRTTTPAGLAALVKTETQRLGQLIQKIGLTAE